jgi:SAM-dependent methyltransferase
MSLELQPHASVPEPSLETLSSLAGAYDALCLDSGNTTEQSLRTLDERLWTITESLCQQIQQLDRRGLTEELSTFRQTKFAHHVLRWFRRHDQTARLWNRPAGYAGDFTTIEWLCHGSQEWRRLEDVFANHVLRCTMTQQHRNKVGEQERFLRKWLAKSCDRLVTIAEFACGPGVALRHALTPQITSCRARMILIDLDREALRFSESALRGLQTDGLLVEYLLADVLQGLRRLSRESDPQGIEAITFGGLFDYLPDRVAVLVLRKTLKLLQDGGELFFTQVSPSNPDRTFMDWWGDWRLIERDESQVLRLCEEAAIPPSQIALWREPMRCTIVAVITKKVGVSTSSAATDHSPNDDTARR